MGMDLEALNGGDFYFSCQAWSEVLMLAVRHGWRPAGTLAPEFNSSSSEPLDAKDKHEWDGSYCWNSYQCVTGDDAVALAAALHLALEMAPELCSVTPLTDDFSEFVRSLTDDTPLFLRDSGLRAYLRDFVEFAIASGGFTIG